MKRERYEALVAKLEQSAARNPQGYRRNVLALAYWGYLMLWMVLLFSIVLAVGSALGFFLILANGGNLPIKAIFIPIIFVVWAWMLAKAMFVTFPRPEGHVVTAKESPQLHAELEELRGRFRAKPIKKVLLDEDFNCSVMQRPRFGLFGGYENYLILGLPCMRALSPEQFRAVLAHEMGHLSENHGRLGAWIYRVRASWSRALEEFEKSDQGFMSKILNGLFGRYLTYFSAYSFAASRQHEYEADRCAAEATNGATLVQSLLAVDLQGRLLGERFWPSVRETLSKEPEPPGDLFHRMSVALRQGLGPEDREQWRREALTQHSTYYDTHPSLRERARAVGAAEVLEADAPPLEGPDAAEHYLGDLAEQFEETLSGQWRERVAPGWQNARQKEEMNEALLAAIEERLQKATGGNVAGLAWGRVCLVSQKKPAAEREPLIREYLEQHPDYGEAHYALACSLLKPGEFSPEAERHFRRAVALDFETFRNVVETVEEHLLRSGMKDRLAAWRRDLEGVLPTVKGAYEERGEVSKGDRFLPHGLTPEQFEPIAHAVAQVKGTKAAYLVKKDVQYYPNMPVWFLLVDAKKPFTGDGLAEQHNAILGHLQEVSTPGPTLFRLTTNKHGWAKKPVSQVPGALIWERMDL